MDIFNSGGTRILQVTVDDNSYRHRAIMGEHNLTLHYSLAVHVEIPVGSYCTFEGQTYTLKRPENFKMKHTRNFEYTVLFESSQADAKIWKFRNTVDGRLKFSLTAKPHEHLEMFVANMNRRSSGWQVGDCIEDVEHCINYDHDFCWEALEKMATEFKTEFEIVGKTVSLHKVEYNKATPLALSYGKGHGFRSGVGRQSNETPPVEYLFIQGGTENIDPSEYGNQTLLLPKNQTIRYDGEHFEDEDGYVAANARQYQVDAQGLYIFRVDGTHTAHAEDSLDCSGIYPKRVGEVSSVVTVDASKNFYDFIDSSIPSTLNYANCQIKGEKMVVVFQSGMLAGHGEFEVNYFHNAVNGKSARRFEIVPKEEDGVTMPNATFKPVAGNKYAVFKVMLPQAYIRDNSSKSGAEWIMFRTAVKYMFDNEEEKFSFTGELDGIWASQDWENIGGKIKLGGFVLFSDTVFQPQGVLVRIVGIKDYINKPHKPELELSNNTVSSGFSSDIKMLEGQTVGIEDSHKDAIDFTKRRFRDAQETMEMLNDLIEAGFDNFSGNINPITVQTMQMVVGDERLQFRFVTSPAQPQTVNHYFAFNTTTRKFTSNSGIIQHMTLGIKTLSSSHADNEYKYWSVAAFESSVLTDGSKRYYLYIKASKTATTAEFILSETAIQMEGVSGYYHFLVGILNSEYEGDRSFAPLYGYTEILPSRITTDKVVSGDGNSYFDMLANALKLGNALSFNVNNDGKLKLKGTIVQSQSGDESPLGCFRGVYSATAMYYSGDEVTYTVDDCTSTYRQIANEAITGIAPTNDTYWEVVSKGARGPQGQAGISPNTAFKSIVFKRSNTAPSTPSGGSYASPVPSGWNDGVPSGEAKLWMSTRIFSSDGLSPQQSAWSAPRQMTDTAEFDVEFSSVENPNPPSGHPNTNTQWSNTSDEDTIWMATATKSNGVWSSWNVTRVKGEKGLDGTSLSVKGNCYGHYATESDWTPTPLLEPLVLIDSAEVDGDTVYRVVKRYGRPRPGAAPGWITSYADVGDAYVMEDDGHLWMGDTDGWKDIGQFRGEQGEDGADGADGLNAYVHIKYAKSATTNDWSDNDGETPDAYIGTYCDHNPTDQLVWSLYTWKKWQGEDGFGYEYIYKRTTGDTAPDTPTATSQADNFVPSGWTADPTGVHASNMYEWICYRKKMDGVWGAFRGSAADNTKAALFMKFGANGSKGDTGDFFEYRYAVNGSPTEAPTITGNTRNPQGWSTDVPTVGQWQYLWFVVAKINGQTNALIGTWSTPKRMTPVDGTKGDSPAAPFRGLYDSTKTYYGTPYRVDVVKYNSHYYVARTDAGEFYNVLPTDTSKWNTFGGEYESIATGFLLAELANIAGFIFKDNKLISQKGTKDGVESMDYSAANFIPNLILDGVNGNGVFRGTIHANKGEFRGENENLFSILMDISNRRFVICGPDDVTDMTNFIARSGASSYEYLTMGDFFHTVANQPAGQSGYSSVRITPKLTIKCPCMAGNYDPTKNYRKIEIDPYNGVVITTHTEWTGSVIENVTIIDPSGIYTDGGMVYFKNLPTSRSWCSDGQLYRDGETLKVRVG